MIPDRGLGSGGLMGWFLQRLTGLLLIPAVLAHVWVTHYVLGDPGFHANEVSYQAVAERLSNPFWKLIDLGFLALVLFHGLRGVWNWLDESVHRPWFRIALFSVVVVLGAALAILGTVTILPFRAS